MLLGDREHKQEERDKFRVPSGSGLNLLCMCVGTDIRQVCKGLEEEDSKSSPVGSQGMACVLEIGLEKAEVLGIVFL